MDARFSRVRLRTLFVMMAALISSSLYQTANAQRFARPIYSVPSKNFVVFASSREFARQVAESAEKYRYDLAMHWLGKELPPWRQRCPLHVQDAPNAPASGETQFRYDHGSVVDWQMSVQGTQQRILDSVLPHEISHTVFATHFAPMNKYMPRWADEGACTTVEHEAEKRKHRHYLREFLQTGRGLPFNRMFRLKDYPDDILPLYAQGHSAVQFLVSQAGPRKFIEFVQNGMATENWAQAIQQTYSYESIGDFQTSWNQWIRDGSPGDIAAYAPLMRNSVGPIPQLPASNIAMVGSSGQANEEGAVQFAVASRPLRSDDKPNSGAPISWYSRRLTEVTGEQPPQYDGRPDNGAGQRSNGQAVSSQASTTAANRMARPINPQSVQLQVQQWGPNGPIQGMTRSQPPIGPTMPLPARADSAAQPSASHPSPAGQSFSAGAVGTPAGSTFAPPAPIRTSRVDRLFGPPAGNQR